VKEESSQDVGGGATRQSRSPLTDASGMQHTNRNNGQRDAARFLVAFLPGKMQEKFFTATRRISARFPFMLQRVPDVDVPRHDDRVPGVVLGIGEGGALQKHP
jgi:hypothetical protein